MLDLINALRPIIQSFREVHREFLRILREEAVVHDLTPLQLMVLLIVSLHPEISLGELSEKLQMTNSTISGVIDRLVASDLLLRERSPEDRRTIVLRLKTEGQAKVDHVLNGSAIIKKMSRLAEIPQREIAELTRIHKLILNKLEESDKEDLR